MWPSCEYPIEDMDKDIVFVTWGVVLNTVANAEEMWPKHGIMICLRKAHSDPLLQKYEHQGTQQGVYNCTRVGDFGNPMTMRALRPERQTVLANKLRPSQTNYTFKAPLCLFGALFERPQSPQSRVIFFRPEIHKILVERAVFSSCGTYRMESSENDNDRLNHEL